MWRIDSDNELHHLAGPDNIVWVPSEQMVVYRADLPLESRQVWEQTVAFVLEEQLLHKVDEMHFAIGQTEESESVPVVCVPLSLMHVWVDLLTRHRIKPRAVYPDFLAIPFDQTSKQPVFWHQSEWCCLRFGLQDAISGSLDWVRSIIQLKSYGDNLRIFSDSPQSLPEAWRSFAEPLPNRLEERMVEVERQSLPVSILQGAFKPTAQILALLKPWSWAAVVLLLLTALFFTELQVKAHFFNTQAIAMEKLTGRIFNAYFPADNLIGAEMRSYMSRRLEQLQDDVAGRQAEADAWQMMLAVEPIFSSCAACIVERIKLTSGVLKIEISAAGELDSILAKIDGLADTKVKSEPLSAAKGRKKVRLILEPEKKT